MPKKRPVYAWDNSVASAWLKDEPSSSTPAARAVQDEIDRGDAVLLISVLLLTELLDKHHEAKLTDFRQFLRRSNVTIVNITMRMADTAGQFRSKGLREKPVRKIKTPDALYMACASLYGADMLHTEDAGMLSLDGSPTVNGLRICKPRPLDSSQTLT